MKNRMMLLALSAGLSLSSCSGTEEKLCRAHVTEGLLNPETASFSDFKAVPQAEVDADGIMREMVPLMASTIPPQGARYYRMRVRADGELSNKVTKIEFCGVDAAKKNCSCLPIDS